MIITICLRAAATAIAATASVNAPRAIHLRFLPGPDTLSVGVEVRVDARRGDTIAFRTPAEWAGQTDLANEIVGLRPLDSADQLIAGDSTWRRSLVHRGSGPAGVAYDVRKDWPGAPKNPLYHRALVGAAWALLVGQNALVLPDDDNKARAVSFDFTALPLDWKIATSYGTGARTISTTTSTSELWNSAIALGDWREAVVQLGNGRTLHVLDRGVHAFSMSEFDSTLTRIVRAERAFWNDPGPRDYLVTLIPARGERGGTRLTGAFTLFIDSAAALDAPVKQIVAHELFHEWNGGVLQAAPGPEGLMKWFSEGFTDYYAWEVVHRAGIVSDAEYSAGISSAVRLHALSSWRDSSSAALERAYWTNSDAKVEPYRRGQLFAFEIDRMIRDSSGSRRSLDDAMRAMARSPAAHSLSDSVIANAFEVAGVAHAAALVDAEIRRPGLVVRSNLLGACYSGDSVTEPRFDIGFDVPASSAAKSIRGVELTSAAYAAGLRDSMPIVGFSFYNGDPGKDATITVLDSAKRRVPVTYRPATKELVTFLRFSPIAGCKRTP